MQIDVSPFSDAAGVRRTLDALTAGIDRAAIVRIVLAGRRAPGLRLEREALALALAGGLRYVEVVDETSVAAVPVDMPVTSSVGRGPPISRTIPSFSGP